MSNGTMLQELRDLARGDKTMPTRDMQRLTLSALAELVGELRDMRQEQQQSREVYLREREETRLQLGKLTAIEMSMKEMALSIADLNSNIAVRIGQAIRRSPKLSLVVFVVFLLVMNYWQVLLFLAGVPPEVIVAISSPIPILTPTP